MSFLGSLFFLGALISGVLVPVYFGRGLAEGSATRMLMSLGFMALAAVFVTLFSLTERGRGKGQAGH